MGAGDSQLPELAELFERALELPESEWTDFAARACGDDDALRAKLLALLSHDRQLGGSVEANPFTADAALRQALPGAVLEGRQIGPFRIAERIGDGGMGSVYRAVRVDGQVEQEAALKLVRADRVNPYLMHRFSMERRVLAALDHPGICRFLDAGMMDGDRPYVLMELVRGQTLFVHCDSQRLGLLQRLLLFRKVLAAVGHAHRNLVVHRDIKSSNVLVNQDGEPKLVDFGIAKTFWDATAGETATQDRFLTPSAAAPEQIEGKPVTVAADVYALGGLLYELLCGAPPFEFDGRSQGEVERLVRDVPPPSMSRRALEGGEAAARARGFPNRAALAAALRGDLDLIVSTCLRKQSEERYASVEQIDAEIERHLQGRPIQARSNERWYRIRRFVARNSLPVALSTALVVTLLVGMGAVLLQSRVVISERNLALLERDRARSAVALLSQAFTAADPSRVAGASVTAADILAAARPALEQRFDTQPELYASLATVVADVEMSLQLDSAAAVTAIRGLEAAERAGLPYADRRPLMLTKARALVDSVREDEAGRTLDEIRRLDGEERIDWLVQRGRLSSVQLDHARAIDELSRAVNRLDALGPQDELAVHARWLLGSAYIRSQSIEEAIAVFQRTQRWMVEGGLGPEHPRVLLNRLWLMDALRRAGRLDEAVAESEIVMAHVPPIFGERSAFAGRAHSGTAFVFLDRGDEDASLEHFRLAYEARKASLGVSHPEVGRTAYNLALNFGHRSDFGAEAEGLLLEALTQAEQRVGPGSQIASRYRARLALQLLRNGNAKGAVDQLLRGPLHPEISSIWEPNLRAVLEAACGGSRAQDVSSESCERLRGFLPAHIPSEAEAIPVTDG